MKFQVKILHEPDITVVECVAEDTIDNFKKKLSVLVSVPVDEIQLIYNGKMIKEGTLLFVVINVIYQLLFLIFISIRY
jgi:hypothetical protein